LKLYFPYNPFPVLSRSFTGELLISPCQQMAGLISKEKIMNNQQKNQGNNTSKTGSKDEDAKTKSSSSGTRSGSGSNR
jgi:hypothetical protein